MIVFGNYTFNLYSNEYLAIYDHNRYIINNKKLYELENSILKISISKDGLEMLLKEIGPIPEKGKDIELPVPIHKYPSMIFKNVKSIESIFEEDNSYVLDYKNELELGVFEQENHPLNYFGGNERLN